MKSNILITVSTIALMGSTLALAEPTEKPQANNAETSTTSTVKEKAKNVYSDAKEETSDVYEKIEAMFIGDGSAAKNTIVTIDSRKTASGIIGHSVYNEKHESIARVSDIILDPDGKASMIVVADGEIFGMGKQVAFDYSTVTRVESDGDVIMPLTEKIIDDAEPFTYNKQTAGEDMRVIPSNGYSVAKLLKGRLLNQKKEAISEIENISFKNGQADQLIVGFDKTLGFGGEQAAIAFNDAKIIQHGSALDFQLSADKSANFETYKNTLIN